MSADAASTPEPDGLAEVREAAQAALLYAITGEREKCVDPLCAIVEMDSGMVHAALCAWSALTLRVFEQQEGAAAEGEFWVLEAEDIATGRPDIDEASPAARGALRFVTCLGNKDYATTSAIVDAVFDDAQALAELLFESVTLAAKAAEFLKSGRDAA